MIQDGSGFLLEAISKIGFWFKIKAGPMFNPQAYVKYSQELKRGASTEIGASGVALWAMP
jgi:hypothetical protein